MHKPESVLENETLKIFWDFEIQTVITYSQLEDQRNGPEDKKVDNDGQSLTSYRVYMSKKEIGRRLAII